MLQNENMLLQLLQFTVNCMIEFVELTLCVLHKLDQSRVYTGLKIIKIKPSTTSSPANTIFILRKGHTAAHVFLSCFFVDCGH